MDRVRKTYQYFTHLRYRGGMRKAWFREGNPYWNFYRIMDLERELGVRSTFFFLQETKPLAIRKPSEWVHSLGSYRFDNPQVSAVMTDLDRSGWEVGLHGSFESYRNPELMRSEKLSLEKVLGHPIEGIRQHYLNLEIPRTWQLHADSGLTYDASLGSRTTYGYASLPAFPFAPFQSPFVVLPLTVMDGVLLRAVKNREARMRAIKALVDEAEARHALLTVLWHQRFLNPREFPEEFHLYELLVQHALLSRPWVAKASEVATWWRGRITGG